MFSFFFQLPLWLIFDNADTNGAAKYVDVCFVPLAHVECFFFKTTDIVVFFFASVGAC